MSYTSRIPGVMGELAVRVDLAVKDAAGEIAEDARHRVPVRTGTLRDAIHTQRMGRFAYAVVAGDTDAFYGHIVEHGSARVPPRPFLIPAFEDNRADAVAHAAALLRDL